MLTLPIREHMEVVDAADKHIGTVERVEGRTIKLTQDDVQARGEHSWLPLSWVAVVDEKVRLNCSWDDVLCAWGWDPAGGRCRRRKPVPAR